MHGLHSQSSVLMCMCVLPAVAGDDSWRTVQLHRRRVSRSHLTRSHPTLHVFSFVHACTTANYHAYYALL